MRVLGGAMAAGALALGLAACVAPATPSPAPPSGPTPLPTGAVTRRADLRRAVVRIEAEGSFEQPGGGPLQDAVGTGSGFLIDPAGIVVTNNHVVGGAGILKVWVDGASRPVHGRKLGLSECSDLALVDIDGEGYPYLLWREEPAEVGLDVFAAGYPLGEPELTLTKGIVAKEHANGAMPWAAVASALEHTATIRPGSSGGPLVDGEGRVLGVNFASEPESGRYFAIARAEAAPILAELAARRNVAWIGLNGQAVSRPAAAEAGENGAEESGVWVSSVDSGSPADLAGVRPGDVVTKLEGLRLGRDGTLAAYCDIVRSHFPDDKLKLEVVRGPETLEGYVNGPKLAPVTSFARLLPEQVALPTPAEEPTTSAIATSAQLTATVAADAFVTVTDDSGAVSIQVPADWARVGGGPWRDDGGTVVGASVSAGPEGRSVLDPDATAGVFFGASRELAADQDPAGLLDRVRQADTFGASRCRFVARDVYEDPVFGGQFDVFSRCGGGSGGLVVVAAAPADAAYLTLLAIRISSEADAEALDHLLDTFQVVGALP